VYAGYSFTVWPTCQASFIRYITEIRRSNPETEFFVSVRLLTNRPIENAAKLKYLGTTVTELYFGETKSRLNSVNACYHSVGMFCLPVLC
jgi:hypothetical protein